MPVRFQKRALTCGFVRSVKRSGRCPKNEKRTGDCSHGPFLQTRINVRADPFLDSLDDTSVDSSLLAIPTFLRVVIKKEEGA